MRSRVFIALVAALAGGALLFVSPAAAEAPIINSAATITGTPAVGQQLTAHNGTWLYADGTSCGSECSMTYQWQRCAGGCSDIPGGTGRFYTVQSADAGHALRVMETMTKEDCGEWNYSTGTRECRMVSKSAPSGQVGPVGGSAPAPQTPTTPSAPVTPFVPAAPLAPAMTSAPSVTGLAMVDHTLSAQAAAWSGSSPLSLGIRWERCDAGGENCVDLGLASTTYTVLAVDVGKRLRIVSSAANAYGARSVASEPTAVVAALAPHAGLTTVAAERVTAPHKLVFASVTASPAQVRRGNPIFVRVTVRDSRGFAIQGAIVSVTMLPVAAGTPPAGVTTNANGNALVMIPTSRRINLSRTKRITLVVTARRPSDRVTSPRTAIARLTVVPSR